jgi:iron-sulfur cluster insertion protein
MLTITASAINKVRDLMIEEKLPDGVGALRMFVKGGGCSGYQYGFTFEEEIAEDDFVFENEGVKVIVDMISSQYLQGATLDYKEEKFNSQFVISNPNAKSTCGCGSSFNA